VQGEDLVAPLLGVVEQRGDPLLAAADLQPPGVLGLVPDDVQAGLRERLVEGWPVPVALGVGQHPVAVEDERGH
jgi:hypothetical protein